MIREAILTTRRANGSVHIAPMGIHERGEHWVVAPFRPSGSLDNLLREGFAVVNFTDDVRVFAGCLTGHRSWPVLPAARIPAPRLAGALAHAELLLERVEDEPLRPRLICRVAHEGTHAPFRGFNRAQSAVVEAAILTSRLEMLPWDKIERELDYLRIGFEKTAGAREREAWGWLMERIAAFRGRPAGQCA